MQSELFFLLLATRLLNFLYLMVKYHENTLKVLELWATQDITTIRGNSKTESDAPPSSPTPIQNQWPKTYLFINN